MLFTLNIRLVGRRPLRPRLLRHRRPPLHLRLLGRRRLRERLGQTWQQQRCRLPELLDAFCS
jgi:hypothetical protein